MLSHSCSGMYHLPRQFAHPARGPRSVWAPAADPAGSLRLDSCACLWAGTAAGFLSAALQLQTPSCCPPPPCSPALLPILSAIPGIEDQGSSLGRGRRGKSSAEKGITPEKWQQHPKVLRKNLPPSIHRLEDLPGSRPHPQLSPRQHWWQSLPLPPTHLRLHLFPVDLFFFSDAATDHFNLILPHAGLCWVPGPNRPRYTPLLRWNPGPCTSLRAALLVPSAESLEGGVQRRDEGRQDSLLGMFLIPKTATSVRVGLPAQALFIQTGGPCMSSAAGSARCGWTEGMDRRGKGMQSFPGWSGQPKPSPSSKDEEGSVVGWRDWNSDGHF